MYRHSRWGDIAMMTRPTLIIMPVIGLSVTTIGTVRADSWSTWSCE